MGRKEGDAAMLGTTAKLARLTWVKRKEFA
jgi:hypothetical protein